MEALEKIISTLKYFDRYQFRSFRKDELLNQRIEFLRDNGYIILHNYFHGPAFESLQNRYQDELENKCQFELPCLSQSLINDELHKTLIDNYFRYSLSQIASHGVTFDGSNFSTYSEAVSKYRPSTLKTPLTKLPDFFPTWLDEGLLDIIEGYMGLRPHLMEAYLRRNFPARYKVMNHFWHRDSNHKDHLLKIFIFFSDCDVENGPHEYIAGTIKDTRLYGKVYYSDDEVNTIYPLDSERRVRSIVKAGTVIIEDTRGLHRANVPMEGFRDLGFAVFIPRSLFSKSTEPLYSIPSDSYDQLSARQKSYIPKMCRL